MKNVAILAVILGVLGSAANAQSAMNEAPVLTLALNSAAMTWSVPALAINSNALANNVELSNAVAMEKISTALEKQLEEKIARELEYAMH